MPTILLARWYCRLRHVLHHGISLDRLTEPLYWYPSAPSSVRARKQTSTQLWRWIFWGLLLGVTTQTFFHLRDAPRARPVEAEWNTFPWFPALWARESIFRLPTDAVTQWLIITGLFVALGIGWVTLPYSLWGMGLAMLVALHEYETRHRAAHAWDDFPWSVLKRILQPLNGWIHAAMILILAWTVWPMSVPAGIALALAQPNRATDDGRAWVTYLLSGMPQADVSETTYHAAHASLLARFLSHWPLWSMIGLWIWNIIEWVFAEPSGVKPRMIALHVLAAVVLIGGAARRLAAP